MKKFYILAFLAALLLPFGSRAQSDTTTLYAGTANNEYVPAYGYWADAAQHNQLIYPADSLTDLVGLQINRIIWYLDLGAASSANPSTWGTWTLSLGITEDSALSALNSTTTLSEAWVGTMALTDNAIVIVLDEPFVYNGGNLLLDLTHSTGSYNRAYFLGMNTTRAQAYYSYTSYGSTTANPVTFMPKTSFVYGAVHQICRKPTGLTLDTATSNSLSISWNLNADAQGYTVMVGDSLIEVNGANDTTLTINGLAPATLYDVKVRSVCAAEDSSVWSVAVGMRTECGAVDMLPFTDDFSNNDGNNYQVPRCWNRLTSAYVGSYNYPNVYYYSYSSSSESYMQFQGQYDGDTNFIVSPLIRHASNDLAVSFQMENTFHATTNCTYDYETYEYICDTIWGNVKFEAGIMTDLTDTSTFVPLYTCTTSHDNYVDVVFYTTDLDESADSVYVAFRMVMLEDAPYIQGPYYSYYATFNAIIDDVVVTQAPNCRRPGTPQVDSVSYDAVQLSWDDPYDQGSYLVKLAFTNENDVDTVIYYTTEETTLFITGLQSDTYYDYSVATLCNDGDDTTDFVGTSYFRTYSRCYSVQNVTVGALTANAASITWSYNNEHGIGSSSVLSVLYDVDAEQVVDSAVYTGTSHVYTGLTAFHQYTLYLSSLCGDADTANATSIQFTPLAAPCAEVVGNGTASYVPFQGYYEYAYTQSLYDASMLNGIDTVRSIAWQIISPASSNPIRLVDVYFGYTNTTTLSTSSYIDVATLTKVIDSVSIPVDAAGWVILPLTTPFVPADTNATKLVIAVSNLSGDWGSITWGAEERTDGSSVYWYRDNTPINPAGPEATYSGTVAHVPNIRIWGDCGEVDCTAPSAGVDSTTTTEVYLSWLAGADETSWQLQYRLAGDSTWTNFGAPVSASPATITGLTPGNNYVVRVGSVCDDTVVYATPIAFSTACVAIAAPFSYVPTNETLPNCWNLAGNGVLEYIDANDNYYESPFDGLLMEDGTLITPEIIDSINTLQVRVTAFDVYVHENAEYGYDEDPTNVALGVAEGNNQYTWIDTVQFSAEQYSTSIVRFNTYAGTGKRIALRPLSSNYYAYLLLQSIHVELLPDCLPPTAIHTTAVTANTAELAWTGSSDSYIVEYLSLSDSNATWHAATVIENTASLAGLTPNTQYSVRAVSVCGAEQSEDTTFFTFRTACVSFNTPFFAGLTISDMVPDCWKVTTVGTPTYAWGGYNNYGSTMSYLFSSANSSNRSADDWLITPAINIPAGDTAMSLIYYVAGEPVEDNANSRASLEVRYSLIGADSVSYFTQLLRADTIDTSYFVRYCINVSALGGNAVNFAFRSTSSSSGLIALTNVGVRNPHLPNYIIGGTDYLLLGDSARYVAYHYDGDTSAAANLTFQWTSSLGNTITGANSDTMQVLFTTAGIDTLRLVVSNIYGRDTQYVYVRIIDPSPITVFPYSTSFETTNTDNDSWLLYNGSNAWVMDTAAKSIGQRGLYISKDGGVTNTYINNKASVSYAVRAMNMTEGIYTFSYDWRCKGENNWDYLRVFLAPTLDEVVTDRLPDGVISNSTFASTTPTGWIDLNPAGGQLSGNDSVWITLQDSINITAAGRRYLIFMWVNDGSVGNNPAAGIDNLTITSTAVAPECEPVTITVDSVAETSVIVNFAMEIAPTATATLEAVITDQEWSDSLAATLTPVQITYPTTTSYTFSNLTALTTYSVAVRHVCSNELVTDWVRTTATTAAHPCVMPTGLTISNLSLSGATASWTAGEAGQTHFQVRLVCAAAGVDSIFDVQGTSYTFTGLTSGLTYSVTVRAACDENYYSNWTAAENFTTTDCVAPTGVTATAQGTTVTVSWQSTGADRYRVVYYLADFTTNGTTIEVANGDTSTVVEGLEGGESYDFYVYSYCGSNLSPASQKATVEVSGVGIALVEMNSVSLYPNPASSMVTIDGIEGQAQVTVVDMNGRVTGEWNVMNGKLTIDVSQLAKGAYFVRIAGEKAATVRKLIVR